ncbi:hypothetical protein [Nocardia sp. NPDC057668]|uniref:hypothetical protein n=1 Tax=Nocardia sp. NPDC057668 TaxID=3346202 RepID=UPI003671BB01
MKGHPAETWAEVSAVLVAAVVAGMAVTTSIDADWAAHRSTPSRQWMLASVPGTAACAAMAAVLVAAICESMSVRTAWLMAGASTALLAGGQLFSRVIGPQMYSLDFHNTVIAGTLLGVLPTLAGQLRLARGALLVGALSGILLASRFSVVGSAHEPPLTEWLLLDPPPIVLIALALGMVGWCAWTHPRVVELPTREVPLRPIAAALTLVSSSLFRTDYLSRQDNWLLLILVGITVTMLATGAAALLLPGRDGVLLAVATAFAIATTALVVSAPLPGWTIALMVTAGALGVIVGGWRPSLGVAVTAIVVLVLVATIIEIEHQAQSATIAVAVTAIGGYCITVIIPQNPATLAIALIAFVAPSVVAAMVYRHCAGLAESRVWFHSPPRRLWAPEWVVVLVTAAATVIALALQRVRGPRALDSGRPAR